MNNLYPRMALTNLKKNQNTYFPYMLTCICAIITFYNMQAIALDEGIAQLRGAAVTASLLFLGTIVVGIFSALLLFYTNSFLIKRRKKELGLYSILGMEKRHIARILAYETVFVAGMSLGLGLAAGCILSRLLFLLLQYLTKLTTPLQFNVSIPALRNTGIVFGGIFLVTLVCNLWQIKIANPLALLQSSRQGEREPKTKWLLTLLGFAALGTAYTIAITVKAPLEALSAFFLAVILVIFGTFALFTAGSIAILKLLRRNKKFYYKPNNFISVSGMMYRMKQNAAGLSSICILSTMVLVVISSTVSLYVGQEDILKAQFPYTLIITSYSETESPDTLHKLLDEEIKEKGVTLQEPLGSVIADLHGYFTEPTKVIESSTVEAGEDERYCEIMVMPLEDHGQELAESEVLLYSINGDYGHPWITLGDQTFSIKEELTDFPHYSKRPASAEGNRYIILVKNEEMLRAIHQTFTGGTDGESSIAYIIAGDLMGEEAAIMECAQALTDKAKNLPSVYVQSKHLAKQSWYAMHGAFLFLGIFLGFLFLLATVLIIYYKQISEGYDDQVRFDIMQKVGMSRKEVRSAIHKQILMVFFLPLLGATVHIAFAFPVISKILVVFYMTNTMLYLLCTGITVLLFIAVYAIVYILTARTYYSLVERAV